MSEIRSRPLRTPSAHIVTAQQMAVYEAPLKRWIAIAIWLVSLAGSIVQAAGGWHNLHIDTRTGIAVIAAVLFQMVVSGWQWMTCAHFSPWYIAALVISATPTFLSAAALFGPSLLPLTAATQTAIVNWWYGYAVLAGFAIALDYFPERVLVRH